MPQIYMLINSKVINNELLSIAFTIVCTIVFTFVYTIDILNF